MNTVIEKTGSGTKNREIICRAGKVIRSGGLVAFPTETVYGLGANALDREASEKIYRAKGRPSDNPLIVHIADKSMLAPLVKEIPEAAEKLMEAFWPGPMTLIFQKSEIVPHSTTGGLDTVAVRFPNHKIACDLIRESGVGIAAPSANLSGKPSPTEGQHVIDDMDGRIDMIIDDGKVGMGLESTIIDVTVAPPMILRPGFITYEMIKEVINDIQVDKAIFMKPEAGLKPKAPGMKYRHYAPAADYKIYRGDAEEVAKTIILLANEKADEGKKTGIITVNQHLNLYEGKLNRDIIVISLGDLYKPEKIAGQGTEYIFGETFSEEHVGWAIMNRLMKAAGYNIVDV